MNKRFKEYNYEITDNPDFQDKENAMSPELNRHLNDLYFDILNGKKKVIDKVLKLIEKYPDNPQLKNYLGTAYKIQGNIKKSYEVNRWIVKEHPNYLFGRLNLAAEYLEKGEEAKIPEILGDIMDIQELYPERKVFHIGEILGFNKMAIHYFLKIGNFEEAKVRLDIMEKLAPEHPDTQEISIYYFSYLAQQGLELFEKRREGAIEVKANRKISRKQTRNVPVFENKEVEYIHQRDVRIDPLLLQVILNLPRESLIRDLEKILIDSIERFNYFNKLDEKGEYSVETFSAPIHALFLLGELRSEESLDIVLEVCSQSVDFLELWFESHLTESFPEIFYYLGANQLNKLKDFVKQPNIYTYVCTAISTTVSQIVFHEPNRRQEVINWFTDVFNFFLTSKIEDQVIDSDTISLMVTDVVEARLSELIPLIEKLYDKGYVLEDIADSLEETKYQFSLPFDNSYKKPLLNIFERYHEIITTWGGYTESEDDGFFGTPPFDEYYEKKAEMPYINPFKNVGRNDPCTCGSGKKFKKCCGSD